MPFIDPDDESQTAGKFKDPDEPAKPKGLRGHLTDFALAATGGMLKGGPLLGMFGESQKQATDLLDRSAYRAGGAVTDKLAGKVSPELAAGAGYATNVGIQAIPTIAGAVAGSMAGKPVMQAGGRQLMQSALKPSKLELNSGKASRAVDTMLKEGYSVSKGGVESMRSAVNSLNDEIAGIIRNSSATIDKNAVASRIGDVIKKYEASIDPGDLQAIEKVWTGFLAHPQLAGSKTMPIQFAQRMKQSGGAKLGEAAYGMGLKPAAERDAYKALVRGLKEEISAAEPSVASLNKRESGLINALKIASNRVAMDANKNPIGLGILNPLTLPMWLFDRSPLAKSLVARGLYSGSGTVPAALGGGLGGLYGHYSAQDEE
jgi:hypothetical protein